jgi:hypothetical protein
LIDERAAETVHASSGLSRSIRPVFDGGALLKRIDVR